MAFTSRAVSTLMFERLISPSARDDNAKEI